MRIRPETATPARAAARRPTRPSAEERASLRRSPAWRDVVLRRMLLVADIAACSLAVAGRAAWESSGWHAAAWALVGFPAWLLLAKLFGLYDLDQRRLRHLTTDEVPRLAGWALACSTVTMLILLAAPGVDPTASTSLRTWGLRLASVFVLRAVARRVWRGVYPPARTLLVGPEPRLRAIRRKLELFPDIHVEVVGMRERLASEDLDDPALLDSVDRVIVVAAAIDGDSLPRLIARCRGARVRVSVVPALHGMWGTASELSRVGDLPFLEYTTWDVSRSTLAIKRLLDVTIAAAALVVLAPVFALVAAAILLSEGRPVLYTQVRASQHGRPFRILKFRSMVRDADQLLPEIIALDTLDEPMFKLAGDPRVTRIGRTLRRTSLDELPQLWNVLLGHMSLVGPRPEQVELVERYPPEESFRLAVKPGLTGPMQVYGRGHLSFEERSAVEREYIENLSIVRDFHLLGLTVTAAITGRGAF